MKKISLGENVHHLRWVWKYHTKCRLLLSSNMCDPDFIRKILIKLLHF